MNRREKKELIQGLQKRYTPPMPQKKYEFIRQMETEELSMCAFLKIQAGYIRKRSWLMAGAVFFLALVSVHMADKHMVWNLACITPFLALITVAESNRSARYGMDELELSSRFSLKTIVMARLAVLGTFNLVLLSVVLPLVQKWHLMSLFSAVLFVFFPYLSAAYLNLVTVRRMHGKEGVYLCAAVTLMLCGIQVVMNTRGIALNEILDLRSWFVIMIVLILLIFRECQKIWRQTEEYVWNL